MSKQHQISQKDQQLIELRQQLLSKVNNNQEIDNMRTEIEIRQVLYLGIDFGHNEKKLIMLDKKISRYIMK